MEVEKGEGQQELEYSTILAATRPLRIGGRCAKFLREKPTFTGKPDVKKVAESLQWQKTSTANLTLLR